MSVLLRLFLGGAGFFVGLVIVIAAALMAGRLGRVLVLVGMALTLLSAVPMALSTYIALCAAAVLWWFWAEPWSARGRTARLALALLATILLLIEAPFHVVHTETLSAGVPVIVLGDSLSAGDRAWPTAFAAQSGCAVDNRAYPGARLAAGVRQLGQPMPPCHVVVALGGNDILGEDGPDRFRADLESVLRAVRASGCRGTMLELPLFPLQIDTVRLSGASRPSMECVSFREEYWRIP